jgi:cytochrome c-type biogenesis protein CcmH
MSLADGTRRGLVVLAALASLAAAADPAERLSDPAQEARARTIFRETRCMVCQGESIDDSEADFSRDLRHVIRGEIAAGKSDGQIRAFLAARYGEYVLFRPPLSTTNAVLWGAPFAVALGGLAVLLLRRRAALAPDMLSMEEEARIADLNQRETL